MEVREATPVDVQAIRDVATAAWHAAHDHIIGADGVDEVVDDWYAADRLREQVARADDHFLVAVPDEPTEESPPVVGFAHALEADADDWGDALLSRIYVAPDWWGDGVGTTLLEAVCDRLRADGHERLQLTVLADNEVGRSFYDARGFEVLEERTIELAGQEVADEVRGLEL